LVHSELSFWILRSIDMEVQEDGMWLWQGLVCPVLCISLGIQ